MAAYSSAVEPIRFGDVAPHVVCPHWSMGMGTLTAGNHVLGTVLGQVTASGKYKILAPGASDGTEAAAAILGQGADASTADKIVSIIERGAVLDAANLTWPAGITNNQKTAAIAQLKALGLIVRGLL